ncbi:MAG: serine/threonine-protein kinase [Acidobacteria bacterium]|nr:serine/threonine-protein kinase [Acidobacteriota bacterium]
MTFSAGDRLGTYEIVAPLGAGGMGEVYRATDTRLKRDVALKVLPAAFTEDAERLARLEREAQLLAQLHHPNIASIFGIEESEGVRALVMELAEGPTLADRLESGPFPVDEALLVSRQIAEALEAAHEKGIIHRDLKPQNTKASIEGKVKVLDFGLAKAMEPEGAASGAGGGSQLAHSPTLTIGATVQGMILGTAAYMAPEQAKGFAVDKRSDIWAFGVVLYEMLVGGTLFAGDSVGDTLAAVIRAEIDLDELPPGTPPAIRRLLRRCLERNPKNRLHDIADARLVIEDALAGRGDEAAAGATGTEREATRPRWLVPALGAVALGALGLGFAAGRLGRTPSPAPEAEEVVVAQSLPPGLHVAQTDLLELAVSRDGRRQAVVVEAESGQTQILLRDLSEVEPRLLPGTEGAHSPFFSPDGEEVGYFAETELRRVSVSGGPTLRIGSGAAGVFATRGAAWSRDGYIYFTKSTAAGLSRIFENGGEAEEVTEIDEERDERTHRWPTALPDGSAVLFTSDTSATTEYYDDARIEAVRPATGERKVLVEGSSMARFLPPDRLVFARGGVLFAQAFDPVRLEVSGRPVALGQPVRTQVASGAALFALAENGTLVWLSGSSLESNREAIWISPDGTQTPVADVSPGSYTQLALAPDGRRAVFGVSAPPDLGLSVVDLERGTMTKLTFGGTALTPVWSPDGTRVAYSGLQPGDVVPKIYWKRADGTGDAERLGSLADSVAPSSFAPDGRELVIVRRTRDGDGLGTAWRLPVDGSSEPISLELSPGSSSFQAVVSPNGRWIAYSSFESGRVEVYVRPFPSGPGKWQVSTDGGSEPHWSAASDAIYLRYGGSILRTPFDTSAGVRLGTAERIGPTVFSGTLAASYDVAADGRVLTFRYLGGRSEIHEVDLALGWGARVARLTSAKR